MPGRPEDPKGRPGVAPSRPSSFGESTAVVPLCDGGAVVVDDETLEGVVLNPVGAFLYARMAAGETDVAALVAAVAAEFDAPVDVVEADVARFVEQIQTRGLVYVLHSTDTRRM